MQATGARERSTGDLMGVEMGLSSERDERDRGKERVGASNSSSGSSGGSSNNNNSGSGSNSCSNGDRDRDVSPSRTGYRGGSRKASPSLEAGDDSSGEGGSSMKPLLSIGSDVVKDNSKQHSDAYWRGVVLFLCVLWASQFAVIEQIFTVAPGLHASTYMAARFSVAAITLLPTYYNRCNDRAMVRGSFFIGMCVFFAFVGQSMGLSMGTSADKSAFIASMTVVWVPLLQGYMRGNYREQKWGSIGLAVTGIAFLELEGSAPPNMADAWSFLQPIGFGTSMVLIENLTKVLHARGGTNAEKVAYKDSSLAIGGVRCLFLAISCLLWALLCGQTWEDAAIFLEEPILARNMLYLGCCTTAGGHFLQTIVQSKVKAQDFALILASEPIFATLFAIVLVGTSVGTSDVIGGALVVLACLSNEVNFAFFSRYVGGRKAAPKVVDV